MPTQLTMYGIKNCDTIKKARKWLETAGIDYQFHDYRADGLTTSQLHTFIAKLGWKALLNTKGTTWRKLPEEQRAEITNAETAAALMLEQPAIIKRPLLIASQQMLLGFNADEYQQFIAQVK